eukprot:TRINITY_DN13326_c0_g1_i2.p2 TRINITY_DN13326_c0_g1~~TRINITY_DN13326_c0_g1_i2.p2  ORF type:complete len:103 (+),score=24.35 TRINITY_DN13326_c0_g1_i2:161-469(+)
MSNMENIEELNIVPEEELATPADGIKIDELDIGAFHPDMDKEIGKNKKKLMDVEESIKEAKTLMQKAQKQKKQFLSLEKQIEELLDTEKEYNIIKCPHLHPL